MDQEKKRKFDAVIVWKFDRWARSVSHLANTLDTFRHLGIQFLSYSENFDTSSPMGSAMFSVAAAFAQLEKDLIGERTRESLRAAKAKGVKLGAPRLNKESAVIALSGKHYSLRKIAKELNVSTTYAHSVLRNNTVTPS